MEAQKSSTQPPRKHRGLRIFGIVVIAVVVLLVVVYFVGTSQAFVKSVVLPRVSKSMNAQITADTASISPFSHVRFRNLKVVTTGSEPLMVAQEVNARYSLMKIIGGDMVVHEVQISSPTINLIQNPDGSSNLDPLTKGKEKKKQEKSKSSKPPKLDIEKFVLSNGTVRKTKNYKGGARDLAEISDLNVTLQNLRNGQNGKLQMGANVAVNNNPPAPGTNGTLQAKLNGNYDFSLKPDLMPASVKGGTELALEKATGSFADVAGLSANLAADLSPTEVKEVALRFQKSGKDLGQLRASGPFDSSKREGKLQVALLSLDRQVLNLVGASKGLDFGSTTINSTNQIELTKGGSLITTIGNLNIGKLAVTKEGQTTPTLDLQDSYNLTVDSSAKSANIQTFTLTGTQNQKQLLSGELSRPMKIAWGENAAPAGDGDFNLTVNGLNLADWKPFMGKIAPAGVVALNLKVSSQQAGKLLAFETTSDMQGLTVNVGSNSLANLAVKLNAQGSAADLKKFDLRNYRADVSQQNQPMITLSGAGQYDKEAQSADMRVKVDGNLPPALKALGRTNATASAGKLGLDAHLVKAKETETVTGNLSLADFTGQYGDYHFDRFGTAMDLDVQMHGKQVQIRKAEGKLNSAGSQGGTFDLTGNWNLDKKSGQLDLKLADFNQSGLRPFLESLLKDKKLVSLNLNSSTSARVDGDNASVKANFQVANLVVADSKQGNRQPALEAKLQLDASMLNKVLDLRQLQATLTPTQRAKNEVQINGKIDRSDANAITGNLKLAADSLDVTRYYDLFASKKEEENKSAGKTQPGETASPGETDQESERSGKPQKEPDAVKLPMRNFVVDAKVGKFHLRDLEITNLNTSMKIDNGTVAIQPLQMAINGAPVDGKMNLDLSVPGYRYNVSFNAGGIPLEPLANTFAPTKHGMYKGTLISQLQVNGAGVTGGNMKKNLGGNLSFNFTNANIQIVNPQLRGFLTPVAAFLGAPELLDSPITQITTQARIANGKIAMNQLKLVSEAFLAESQGEISIADDLMKSRFDNWPMHLSIRRSIAQKVQLAPKDGPADQPYVPLPDFIQVAGTLHSPRPKLDMNAKAIAGTLLQKYGGKIPGVDEKTGSLIQGLGGMLGGGSSHTQGGATNQPRAGSTNQPSATSTNGPGTNPPGKFNPFQLLDKFRK